MRLLGVVFRFIFHLFFFFLIICFLLFAMLNIFGARMVESWLESILPSRMVSVGSLTFFPPYVEMSGFQFLGKDGSELKIDSMKARVNILEWEVAWIEIKGIQMYLTLQRNNKQKHEKKDIISSLSVPLGFLASLPIREIVILDSDVHLVREGDRIGSFRVVKGVLYRPAMKSKYFSFDLNALLISDVKGERGRLRCNGWLDWDNKNALFTLIGEDLDISFLAKLFSFPHVIKGIMDIRVEGDARNNDLVLKNSLRVEKFSIPKVKALRKVPILPAFLPAINSLSRPEFSLEFTIKTKLDHPKIELKRYIVEAIERMTKGPKEENNQEDKGQFYDIINGLVDLVGSVIENL